jgi:hypothetical protein
VKSITPEKSKLGFVASATWASQLRRGELNAYDRDQRHTKELVPYGGSVVQSILELFSSCDVVLSCQPYDEVVLGTVATRPNGTRMGEVAPENVATVARPKTHRFGAIKTDLISAGEAPFERFIIVVDTSQHRCDNVLGPIH